MKKTILIVIIVLIVVFLYSNSLLILTKLRFPQSKYPLLYQTPVARELSCPSFATDSALSKLSYYGISLQAPWTNIVDRKENKDAVQIVFENNKHIVIFDEKKGIKDAFLQGDPREAQKIKDFFGDAVLASNYALYDALLNIKPVFFSFKNPTAKSILLVLKASIAPPSFSSG